MDKDDSKPAEMKCQVTSCLFGSQFDRERRQTLSISAKEAKRQIERFGPFGPFGPFGNQKCQSLALSSRVPPTKRLTNFRKPSKTG